MKILMLNATPHKGNTWIAMRAIREEILKLNPKVQFDEMHLSELKLPFCVGCSMCFRKGSNYCPHYSIMEDVFCRLEESDGLIFGASTFNMAPNALAKNLIDHLCFMIHRPHFFTKKAIVISTTGGVFANKTVKYLEDTLKAIGFNFCYKLPIATHSWNAYQPSLNNKKRINQISNKFYYELDSGKLHSPTVGILIPYNLFRGMSLGYVKGTEYETEDGSFWTDSARATNTYDPSIRVPLYKRWIGHLFYWIGKTAGKSTTITYKK